MCTKCKVDDLVSIFLKSIEAVHPPKLIKKHIYLKKNTLYVYDNTYHVNNNCYIVGFGKAVYEMSIELEKILGNHLVWGFVSIPIGIKYSHPDDTGSLRVLYMEGAANNLPDKSAENAAAEIVDLVKPLTKDDLLFVLISGGGSALLPAPIPSISLKDKTNLIKLLSNRGANIIELNCVRKSLSTLKGGGLAALAYPAKVVSLILSDVIGDPLDCIASGPTVPNTDPPELAKEVIFKYLKIGDPDVPLSVFNHFLSNSNLHSKPKLKTKFPKIKDGNYINVDNILIGNNSLAINKAAKHAKNLGYDVTIMSNSVSANVAAVSKAYTSIAIEFYQTLMAPIKLSKKNLIERLETYNETLNLTYDSIPNLLHDINFNSTSGKCLIFGGEPTVLVKGNGKGGRNQQLALQFSIDVDAKLTELELNINPMTFWLLSGGTDGIDGPTNAAGAIGFNGLCQKAIKNKMNPDKYVKANDSYNFYKRFQNGQYLIRTGHTGTNVMDIHILLIQL